MQGMIDLIQKGLFFPAGIRKVLYGNISGRGGGGAGAQRITAYYLRNGLSD